MVFKICTAESGLTHRTLSAVSRVPGTVLSTCRLHEASRMSIENMTKSSDFGLCISMAFKGVSYMVDYLVNTDSKKMLLHKLTQNGIHFQTNLGNYNYIVFGFYY